jgi:hypothetical protein
MRKNNTLLTIGILLLSTSILLFGCKKDKETITPEFTVTATNVQLQGGIEGLQFFGKCTNDDVKMTKATITDPLTSQTITYNLNGNYFVKNEAFALQDANVGYVKELGTWTFDFVGNRTADNTAFNATATLQVTGK